MARKGLIILDSTVSEASAKDLFIRFETAKNIAPATFCNYKNVWFYFFSWYKGEITRISQKTISDWIISLKQKGTKAVTINSYLRYLKTILNFFAAEKWIESIHFSLLPVQETIKETYSDEELKKLLDKPNKHTCTFAAFRNWVIVNTLIGTGIRRSTMINLKITDVDLKNGFMNMSHTKNKKANVVPVSSSLLAIFREYLALSRLPSNSYLFPDAFGSPLKADRLSHIVSVYNKQHGVSRTSVHAFRHTYAKLMIMNGCDVFKLQKLLGHSTLEMTRRYVELYSIDLKQGYDDINPLDRITANRKRIMI